MVTLNHYSNLDYIFFYCRSNQKSSLNSKLQGENAWNQGVAEEWADEEIDPSVFTECSTDDDKLRNKRKMKVAAVAAPFSAPVSIPVPNCRCCGDTTSGYNWYSHTHYHDDCVLHCYYTQLAGGYQDNKVSTACTCT